LLAAHRKFLTKATQLAPSLDATLEITMKGTQIGSFAHLEYQLKEFGTRENSVGGKSCTRERK
jgi:hypothetical protein